MKPEFKDDVQIGRGHIKVGYLTLVTALIAGVGGVWVAAGSYFDVKMQLRELNKGAVTRTQFQGWLDDLREANAPLPLKVPKLPITSESSGDVLTSETRMVSRKE